MSVFGSPDDLSAQAGGTGTVSSKLRTLTEQLGTLGASGDAAVLPGGAGSHAAKLRLLTSQLNQLALGVPLSGGVSLRDPTTGNLATITAFHNTDNQVLSATTYGLMTGGVAQLVNPTGNLDRQRETGLDGISALGVATGTGQLASPFTTTLASPSTSGSATLFTPVAMSGTNRGSKWSIQVGSNLSLDGGSNLETVTVTAVTTTTFTAKSTFNHLGGTPVSGFVYNQARDATAPDGTVGQGFAAGATYLLNSALNSGAGGWEGERSAAGELDGATGAGTAVAAGYECNSGGPAGALFDRARNLQGKGIATLGIAASGGLGQAIVTLAAAPSGLLPGAPLTFFGGTTEVAYTSASYGQGSNPVLLQSALVFAGHTSAAYDQYVATGPALSGFLPTGISLAEEALYNPVDGYYYLERSATQDAMPAANIVAENGVLWNGTGMDRMRAAYADGLATTGIEAANDMLWNGNTYDRARSVSGDAMPQVGIQAASDLLWNGNTYDRPRGTLPAGLTTATGLPAMAGHFFDTAALNWRAPSGATLSDTMTNPTSLLMGAMGMLWNGLAWERVRTVASASGTAGTGLLGVGVLSKALASLPAAAAAGNWIAPYYDLNGRPVVTLGTLINGEDATNGRMLVDMKPVDSDSVLETMHNAAAAAVSGTVINVKNYKSVSVTLLPNGSPSGTVTFEGSLDDSDWQAVPMISSAGTTVSTATAAGTFHLDPRCALSSLRARISTFTNGTFTVRSRKAAR